MSSSFVMAENDIETEGALVEVRFPDVPSDPVYRERSRYFAALLELALANSGRPHKLTAHAVPPFPASRTVKQMADGRYNVAWAHTDPQRESELRPIRIPMYRGLGGWRLLFIREEDRELFSRISTVDQLREPIGGQGHDWPDTQILRANGFDIRTSVSRDSLFQLLNHKRIDFFPRGLNEVWDEQGLPETKGLIVEKRLVLRYPTAFYLFVTRDNEELANILETGLERAIASGAFQRMFMQFMGETIKKADLKRRTILEITNPTLSSKTPLERKELWFHPSELSE